MPKLKLRQAHKRSSDDLSPKALAYFADTNFIPFVCHYDTNSILTKNGELLQVIKVTGFNHESIASELVNLREAIRDSIAKHINSDNFALWINTVRRKHNIAPGGKFTDYFSQKVNEIWEDENNWRNQYVNELFLTIIIEGYDTSITNIKSLLRSFSSKSTKKLHKAELQKSHEILNNISNKILSDLNEYGAELLGIEEQDDVLYSEPMRFFGKMINLNDKRYPLSPCDMSEHLISRRIAFGNRSLELIGERSKHFGAMLSLKEYNEVSVAALDKILQLPQEFIISQSIDFIHRNKALAAFDYQHYILDVSGDEQLKYLSGLDSIIESDSGSMTDYGKQQITIMLINKNTRGLQANITRTLEKLYELGLVTIREDIFSEHCYWSQLPANFKFLRRQRAINIARIGGFASLHNFPAGSREYNHWGDAVTIFRTVLGTPYFFNFHDGSNGHTAIIGPLGSGKTVLLNFMVCQSRKFNNKLYYFGYNHSGKIFINALGGRYLSITTKLKHPDALKINPLNLAKNEKNQKFLSDWFRYLVTYGQNQISDKELKLIPQIVRKIIFAKINKLSKAAKFFESKDTQNIHKKLAIWHSQGKYAFVFDHEDENDLSENIINAFDLTPILKQKALLVPIISYLLYKIEQSLDGQPTMIVLDEAWKLIDNYAIGPNINDFLTRLKAKNCIAIFATESITDVAKSSITKAIYNFVTTNIFLPNPNPTNYYKTTFGLNNEEFQLLFAMSRDNHHFLLKHGEDTVIAALDLSTINEIIAVLSANKTTIAIMEKLKKEHGANPKDWIPYFFEEVEKLGNKAVL